MRKIVILILLLCVFSACKEASTYKIDVSNINVTVNVIRFEQDFYKANSKTFPRVKQQYPMLFPHNIDSVWVNKITSSQEQELFSESQKFFADFSSEKKQIEQLFKHIKYYNPKFVSPKIITMLTNMDSRVLVSQDFVFISLDGYLGKDHQFYNDFPAYIRQKNMKEHLIVDVANAFIAQQILPNTKRRFIDKMIYEGKKLYLLDRYLPKVSDAQKIAYSKQQFLWAQTNEENVWRYFIDKGLLYSTDQQLNQRFLDEAPFSKFYLEHDSQTPGQIAKYIGWQIVRSFMDNNDVSLQELVQTSEEVLFKQSKYKPRR